MASKRGLTLEEKRKRMLEFFNESQDFFQLKDVEKICSQEKGITQQTVKDVLNSLVDDGLVDSEKIGTSIYYWSLPSKALKNKTDKLKSLETDLKNETSKNEILKKKFESFGSQEDDSEKRKELNEKLAILNNQKQKFLKELDSFKENDPELVKQMRDGVVLSKKACNRWIENIFSLKSWLKNKYKIENAVIDRQFELPEDLDYIE